MPRRGRKKIAGWSRNDVKRRREAVRERREQETQQGRTERLKVHRERMRKIREQETREERTERLKDDRESTQNRRNKGRQQESTEWLGDLQERTQNRIISKCFSNIYSTNPSSVASSEEPFKIIVKVEPPDDYETHHEAIPVILDCDGLKCKEEKEFLNSEGWYSGTNCDLQNKTMNKSFINEEDASSSAVSKQSLISPVGVATCFFNIYSTNPSSVASSECCEEPFKIIVKEEPPDDYESHHVANPVILDFDGLMHKEGNTFLDSEGWDGGINCDLQNNSMHKSSISEVDATSSAVTKQPLFSPTGVAKAKMLRVECTKVPVVYFEPCTFTNGTIQLSVLPQELLSSCQRKGGRIPIALQSPNSAKKPTYSSSSAENSQVENIDSKSVCSGPKESSSASEKNMNKTSTSTVSHNPTASPGTPPEKSAGEGFRFHKMKYTEKELNSRISRTPQDALQSHLVEHVSEDLSNPIHPTADPQESEEETIERLEEQLLEDLSHLDPRVIMHPFLERAGLKPNLLLSTDNLKSLGVVISPSSASNVRTSPIKQVQEPLEEEVSFVSRTGKTNDFTKLKGWKQKLGQHSGSSTSKQTQTSAKPEYSLKYSSVFSSDKLDEYLENEEKMIQQCAALCVKKTSKVVYQMPTKSSSYVRTLDGVLKSRLPQTNCRGSRTSNRISVSPQPISVVSVSKNTKQIAMTLGPVSDHKDQKSANNENVSSTPAKSSAKTNLQPSFAPTRPGLSKKQIQLMNLENGALVEKPRTCITEERAEASLVTLLTAQENIKGNNSGTVTACKLNRCRNSTIIEAMDSEKLDSFERNSMSPNATQTSKWKQKERTHLPLHCDSPQEKRTSLQSETPQPLVETKNTLELIEIISDCNWESERSNILGVLAQCTANKRLLEKIRIGNFLVEIVSTYGKSRDSSPGSVLISSSVVKISQSSEKEGNGKYSGCNMSVPTISQSPGIQLTETRPIAPNETLPTRNKCTVQEKEVSTFHLGSIVAGKQKHAFDTPTSTARKSRIIQFSGNANGDTKQTLGQVGSLHPVNWAIANLKNKIKIVEPFKTSSSMVASSASAHFPSKHLPTCSTSSGNEVLRDTNDATPVNQAKGVSKHPEASNFTPPDLSNATKTDRPQFLLIPVQSTPTARPAQNLQLTPGQMMILQPLRFLDGKLFQHPNGQISQLVPLPNLGPMSIKSPPNGHSCCTESR